MNRKINIEIIGNIGSGKTTLSECLSLYLEEFGSTALQLETLEDNPYLQDLFKDFERYSFQNQIHVLMTKVKQCREKQNLFDNGTQIIIQDTNIQTDKVFKNSFVELGYMKQRESNLYDAVFDNLSEVDNSDYENYVFYIDIPVQKTYEQIKKRNRPFEQGIELRFLETLKTYFDVLAEQQKAVFLGSNFELNLKKIQTTIGY